MRRPPTRTRFSRTKSMRLFSRAARISAALRAIGAEVPAQHNAVIGPAFFIDGLGKTGNIVSANARPTRRFADVERNAVAHAVNSSSETLSGLPPKALTTNSRNCSTAVLFQPGRFVDAPMLHCKIRNGKELADLFLHHLGDAVGGNGYGNPGLIRGDPAAVEALRDSGVVPPPQKKSATTAPSSLDDLITRF